MSSPGSRVVQLAAKQKKLYKAASKIQAIVRSFIPRNVDQQGIAFAHEMLKFYKNHQTMLQAKEQEDTKENIPHSILDPNISKESIQLMATCHLKMTKAATKIQAFGCGNMVHKFDKHSMMKVIT
jgi:hypothetical protein